MMHQRGKALRLRMRVEELRGKGYSVEEAAVIMGVKLSTVRRALAGKRRKGKGAGSREQGAGRSGGAGDGGLGGDGEGEAAG